jgi:5-methyltetrahydrofolate--homocysteine methyltransferase
MQKLVSDEHSGDFAAEMKRLHARKRDLHKGPRLKGPTLSLDQARANRFRPDWDAYRPPRPRRPGVHVFEDFPLAELVPFIDWMPFFNAWEFSGRFPEILDDPARGAAARHLHTDARSMLTTIIDERWLQANATVGLFPAASDGDDVIVYTDESRTDERIRLHFLREQRAKGKGRPNLSLADYIAPVQTGRVDWIGGFAVTAGLGIDPHVRRMEAEHDDYHAILLKALADRLAEAFAECLHQTIRRDLWGYAGDERLDNDALIREEYTGIRPAPGYPACPDHLQKQSLWRLLGVEEATGITLTESCAMWPAASVSGFYFSHPDARYFSVGKIGRDQVEDYARRSGIGIRDAEAWLGPSLGYPRDAA